MAVASMLFIHHSTIISIFGNNPLTIDVLIHQSRIGKKNYQQKTDVR